MVDKSDYSYYIQPPDVKGRELKDYYKKTQDYRHVPPYVVDSWRRMIGMRRKVEHEYNKPIEEIENDEIARFVLRNYGRNLKIGRAEIKKKKPAKPHDIEQKLQSYLQYYEAKTANDIASLRQLCVLETTIEKLEQTEADLLKDINGKDRKVSDTYINSIVNARLRYLAEYRQLQMMLGVDRLTRDKQENETGGADYMRSLMRASKELLDKKAVKISCPNCQSNDTLLNMGFILCHFDGWLFNVQCPRCKQEIQLKG